MSSTVIRAEGLSKQYRLGVIGYGTLQQDLQSWWARFRRREDPNRKIFEKGNSKDFVWALNDVSFEVEEGERLGIIGRNGAGKSTLLKILSRVTSPTKGEAGIKGRIASLLEVGTGFHPELTGRENIFLNGAILGMNRREIRGKFDEIVDFSGVEAFIDTPIKRYSSGMHVRLAFAVAAHLEPEILLVDEVLAVGDAQFQKKCLGKMREIGREGRTILFVSHNMNAVEKLCNRALLLAGGRVAAHEDDVRSVIKCYLQEGEDGFPKCVWENKGDEYSNPWFQPFKFYMGDGGGRPLAGPFKNDDEFWVYVEGRTDDVDPALTIGYAVFDETGQCLYWSYQTDSPEGEWPKISRGANILRSQFPKHLLNEGEYRLEFIGGLHFRSWLFEPGISAPAFHFTIQGGLSESPYWLVKRPGILAPVIRWSSHVQD